MKVIISIEAVTIGMAEYPGNINKLSVRKDKKIIEYNLDVINTDSITSIQEVLVCQLEIVRNCCQATLYENMFITHQKLLKL